jgi:hypothetical protein
VASRASAGTKDGAEGGPKDGARDEPPANPFQLANTQLRDVAKWLIGAFAAVGTVMLAGTQLSSLGALSTERPGRLVTATVAAVVVVLATLRAIFLLTKVLTLQFSGLHDLVRVSREREMAEVLRADSGYLAGRANVGQLLHDYEEARNEERRARARRQELEQEAVGHTTVPGDLAARLATAKAQEELADRRTTYLQGFVLTLVRMTGYFQVRRTFEDVRRGVLLMAMLSAFGLIAFAWAANPPKEDAASEASPVVRPAPAQAVLVLTAAGRSELEAVLGEECAALAGSSGVPVVALAADDDGSEVVVLGEEPCATNRLHVAADLGRLVPTNSVTLPAPLGSEGTG